jgi:ethanolamine utilization protein EutQ (cupin superfamily)
MPFLKDLADLVTHVANEQIGTQIVVTQQIMNTKKNTSGTVESVDASSNRCTVRMSDGTLQTAYIGNRLIRARDKVSVDGHRVL